MTLPIATPPESGLLDRAVRAWRGAQVVHEGPAWDGRPEARALAEEVARHPELEASLRDLLADPRPLVAAYALISLELMGGDRVLSLPEGLFDRASRLTIQVGSFRDGIDLGSFARRVAGRASPDGHPGPA